MAGKETLVLQEAVFEAYHQAGVICGCDYGHHIGPQGVQFPQGLSPVDLLGQDVLMGPLLLCVDQIQQPLLFAVAQVPHEVQALNQDFSGLAGRALREGKSGPLRKPQANEAADG